MWAPPTVPGLSDPEEAFARAQRYLGDTLVALR
jgi:hypothetical protein